ncbi:uncharacterized protein APUU_11089A [Aspergillus puulaauensis]|uniref:Clr5 domain-containing protein n=1 Tax=Aspergillus puulaauensis TaxID=1220207 RepID=A0A7R7XBK3_9EURO|nr:uncharacterized protein APUU_11089A [Aspergillus puulaauensis]BCS18261.1 hypothetical protein APUU_11089A [Aspergillus puulaauensis]
MADDSWDAHRAEIEQLYIQDNKTLKCIAEFMSSKGFRKTKSQYETQFKKWGLRKKQTVPRNTDWNFIAKRVEKRKRLGKENEVVIDGETIPSEKVRKLQYGKMFVSTADRFSGYGAPSPKTPEGVVVRTPSSSIASLDQAWCGGLSLTWNASLPWLQFTKLLQFNQDQHRPALSPVIPIPLSSEVSVQPDVEKAELIQRLAYAFPSKIRSQLRYMDIDSRIRAMLTVLMPEEYEGQHQLTQTNRLSIELYILSNNLEVNDRNGYRIFVSIRAHNERLLAMIRTFGWHKGRQFKSLLASREPTVEAIVEKVFASAVFQVDIEVVKLILEAGMDPNSLIKAVSGGLFIPLQWAATVTNNRAAEMAEVLISHNADIELRYGGSSALFRAIANKNMEVIEVLLRHNVVVSLPSLAEATGIDNATLFEKLFTSCSDVNSLIYNTTIMDYRPQRGNITLLGAAARSGRLRIIEIILRRCPSLVNPRELEATGGADYFSPISVAIANNNTYALKALLDAGVDTNFVNGCERPIIEQALAKYGNRAYKILVKSGYTITHQPMSYKRLSVLMRLCIAGKVNYTIEQLIGEIARPSYNFTEWSGEVLAEAINNNEPLVIGLLLDFGATIDPNKVIGTWDEGTARYLDTRGALQAILDENGPKILLKALELGKWDLAQWLVIRAPVLLDESLYSRNTPLSIAASSKQAGLVKFMLKHGARVTDHALFMATKRIKKDAYIGEVSSDEGFEVLRILLSHFSGPAPTAIAEAEYGRPDIESTDKGTDQDIYLLELLLSEGVEPTGTPEAVAGENWYGLHEPQSALEIVARSGNRMALEILTQTPYNWGAKALGRALATACSLPNEGLIDRILKHKPNMNEEIGFWRYLPGSPYWKSLVTFSTALQGAVRKQSVSVVRKLLGFADTDINYAAKGAYGRTALQYAVENGNVELVMILLNHGADINSVPAEYGGATALQLAAIQGYLGLARRLIDLGANVNAAGADIEGRTALEGAAEHGRVDMVHMLLDEGALIFGDAGEKQYKNAVQRARGNGHYAVARMLEAFKNKVEQSAFQVPGMFVDGWSEVSEEEKDLIV